MKRTTPPMGFEPDGLDDSIRKLLPQRAVEPRVGTHPQVGLLRALAIPGADRRLDLDRCQWRRLTPKDRAPASIRCGATPRVVTSPSFLSWSAQAVRIRSILTNRHPTRRSRERRRLTHQ